MSEYSIQELSDLTNFSRRTIHFYAQQGLIPSPDSAGVGTKYFDRHLLCLQVIPLMKKKGLKLDEIRDKLQTLDESGLRRLYEEIFETAEPEMLPASQPFTHYHLPAGMTLAVPATLTPKERKHLSELLKAVQDIFSR